MKIRVMKSALNKIVGLRIKRAREKAGLTQEDLAGRTDRTKEAISNIERGVNLPSLETLYRICEETGVGVGVMLEDTEQSAILNDLRFQIDMKISELGENELQLLLSVLSTFAEYKKGNASEKF